MLPGEHLENIRNIKKMKITYDSSIHRSSAYYLASFFVVFFSLYSCVFMHVSLYECLLSLYLYCLYSL